MLRMMHVEGDAFSPASPCAQLLLAEQLQAGTGTNALSRSVAFVFLMSHGSSSVLGLKQ